MESDIKADEGGKGDAFAQDKKDEGGLKKNYTRMIIVFVILVLAIPAGLFIKDMINRSDPEYYLRFQNQGIQYYKEGNLDKAAAEFKKAVKYGPDRFDTHFGLGQTYLMMKNHKAAIAELEKALKINPGHLGALYSVGVAYQQTGKDQEALKAYYVVGKNLPNSFQVYYNMGIIHLKAGSMDKAVIGFKESITLKPDFYPAYIALGQTYATMGDKALARKEYEKVRKMTSGNPQTLLFANEAEKRLAELGN